MRSNHPFETAPRSFLLGVLVLWGALAYGTVLGVPFMWDDPQMILANPHITSWTWDNLKHTFTHDVFNQGIPYYRPLQTLLNMVDFSLYGFRPWGYHLTNLLIHLANILLVFFVLGKIGFARISAFWIAGAFAVHPIIVQELMVVAGRAELLSSFFVLLGIGGWISGTRSGWVLSILCLPVAILAKESGVVLPFLILVVSASGSKLKERWRDVLPHAFLLVVYLILRRVFLGEVVPATGLLEGVRFLLFQAPKILFVYARLLFVPWHLHSHRYQPAPGPDSLVLLGIAFAGLAWLLHPPARRGSTLFWLGWFFAFLLPKIPLLATNSLMLEHWVYLAGIGAYGPMMVLLSRGKYPWLPALPILFWMGVTQYNIHVRGSDALNFAHSARFSRSPWLRHNWGRDLLLRGHPAEAAALFQEILQGRPDDLQARNGLALAYLGTGQTDQAVATLKDALRRRPSDPTSWNNLAAVYLKTGNFPQALECAEKAVNLDPGSSESMTEKAECLRVLGRWPEAVDVYRAAIQLNPAQCDARNNLAGLLAQSGDLKGAVEQMEAIVRINPTYPGATENMSRLHRMLIDVNKKSSSDPIAGTGPRYLHRGQ